MQSIKSNGTVSIEKIQNFENQNGIEFPQDYVSFLQKHNGGKPHPHTFEYKLHDGRSWTGGVRDLFGFDLDNFKNIDFFADMRGDRVPENMIPIGVDDGGNFILLGLSGQAEGKVYFWDHNEESEDGDPPTDDNVYFMANNFTEFLNNLKEE